MVEKKIYRKEIQLIEKKGKFEDLTKKDHTQKEKLNKLIYTTSNAKDFRGFLLGRIKIANSQKNEEIAKVLEYLLNKYEEFEK